MDSRSAISTGGAPPALHSGLGRRAGARPDRGRRAARATGGGPRELPVDRRAGLRRARPVALARLLRRARDGRPAALAARDGAAVRPRAADHGRRRRAARCARDLLGAVGRRDRADRRDLRPRAAARRAVAGRPRRRGRRAVPAARGDHRRPRLRAARPAHRAGARRFPPPLVVIPGDLVSEPLGALTVALVLVALAWAWRTSAPWRFAVAGAATAAAILVRADLLVLPLVLAAVVALTLRRAGARPALLAAGAYLLAAALALAPWTAYASSRRGELTPVTSSQWSALFVGSYLPAHGRIFELREKLGDEARAHNREIRHVRNENLRTEWILDAVAARHPDLGRSDALRRETLRNLRVYALGRPRDFAAMQAGKVARMWVGYDRGTHHLERAWILALHLLVSAAALGGLLYGLWRTRHPVLWAILATVLTATAVNSFFVSEARHNVRLVPLLVAGGAAGVALARRRVTDPPAPAERSEPPRVRASEPRPARVARAPGAGAVR